MEAISLDLRARIRLVVLFSGIYTISDTIINVKDEIIIEKNIFPSNTGKAYCYKLNTSLGLKARCSI
jgi:hypothetical protein